MNAPLKALDALLHNYLPEQSKAFFTDITAVISKDEDFLEKINKVDRVIEKHPAFSDIREFVFDLIMVHHLEVFIKDEDYLDSKEWMDIEDKTIERGTELLNILLYISEAREDDIAVTIDDFLFEFLLVDEDEFQDEHRIYEDLIVNQDLVEEDLESILRVSTTIPEDSEIKELFTPLFLFFQNPEEKTIPREAYNKLKPMERAVLACLLAFKNS